MMTLRYMPPCLLLPLFMLRHLLCCYFIDYFFDISCYIAMICRCCFIYMARAWLRCCYASSLPPSPPLIFYSDAVWFLRHTDSHTYFFSCCRRLFSLLLSICCRYFAMLPLIFRTISMPYMTRSFSSDFCRLPSDSLDKTLRYYDKEQRCIRAARALFVCCCHDDSRYYARHFRWCHARDILAICHMPMLLWCFAGFLRYYALFILQLDLRRVLMLPYAVMRDRFQDIQRFAYASLLLRAPWFAAAPPLEMDFAAFADWCFSLPAFFTIFSSLRLISPYTEMPLIFATILPFFIRYCATPRWFDAGAGLFFLVAFFDISRLFIDIRCHFIRAFIFFVIFFVIISMMLFLRCARYFLFADYAISFIVFAADMRYEACHYFWCLRCLRLCRQDFTDYTLYLLLLPETMVTFAMISFSIISCFLMLSFMFFAMHDFLRYAFLMPLLPDTPAIFCFHFMIFCDWFSPSSLLFISPLLRLAQRGALLRSHV